MKCHNGVAFTAKDKDYDMDSNTNVAYTMNNIGWWYSTKDCIVYHYYIIFWFIFIFYLRKPSQQGMIIHYIQDNENFGKEHILLTK